MRQIAAEVGVQAGALYNYTPDKQALLFSLMKGHMDELLAARAARRGQGSPEEQLRDFVDFHIRFHLQRPDEVFIAYMELRNLDAENFERIEALRRAYEDELEALLLAGVEAGEFSVPDAKIATLAVIAMLTGVTTWYRPGGRLSEDEVSAIYCQMVRKSLGNA